MRLSDQETNRLRVLKAIRRAEPVARTELAALTGLAGGTITELTKEFLQREILLEEKSPALGKGRPRQQLRFNPDKARVVGASIVDADGSLQMTFANLRGDKLLAQRVQLPQSASIAALGEHLATILEETIAASPFRKSDIHCVGIGLPAMIDSISGVVHWIQTFPLGPVPVADIIETRLGIPVLIDNNCNVAARAEHWFGPRPLDDFCLIELGIGFGFSRYVSGALRTGAHGMNPELAHVKVVFENGRACLCGAKGCLLVYCTSYGIVSQICEARGGKLPQHNQIETELAVFAKDAKSGDTAALEIFERAGKYLGIALANHINVADPGGVIVLASDPTFIEMISAPFHAALDANTLPALRGRAPVEFRMAAENTQSQGAAALALEQLYRTTADSRAH